MTSITCRTFLAGLAASAALAAAGDAQAGDGSFGPAEPVHPVLSYSIAVGDVNGDGRPDVAAVNGAQALIALGVPGGFRPGQSVPIGTDAFAIVIADLNADGHDDLVVAAPTPMVVRVRLGRGDGTFTAAPDIAPGLSPRSVAVGDFNADGREDLAIPVTDANTQALTVRLGRGDSTFADGGGVSVAAAPLAVGDFDEDGVEDLAYGRLGSVAPAGGVLRGLGGGALAPHATIRLVGMASTARGWTVGDFDADGHLDLAAAADLLGIRFGAGDGTFEAGLDLRAGEKPWTPVAGDFDGDGDEDLAVTDAYGSAITVHLNDGRGAFAPARELVVATTPTDLAAADVDGDGNDDLVVATAKGVHVHRGLGPAPLAGNLLVNGGFEGAGATGVPAVAPEIPGWQRSGRITFARYGIPSHAYFPSPLDAPRHGGGRSLLWGGDSAATGGVTEAFQDVDVSGAAASIDAGLATAHLSAWLGGALRFGDRMRARAEFAGAAGAPLGGFDVGPVTAAERRGLTTLLRRAGGAPVPPGTRTIRVRLTSFDDDRTYSSATADNVKLTLDAPSPPELPGPPAPPGGGAAGGAGGATPDPVGRPAADRTAPRIARVAVTPATFAAAGGSAAKRARRAPVARGTTVRLALSEPAALTLAIQGLQRGRRAGAACRPAPARSRGARRCQRIVDLGTLRRAGRAGANRIAFDGRVAGRALRPGVYRLAVAATDAAGNRATAPAVRFRVVRGGR